ncbi:MAG: DUF5009 domain-containing protein [Planctomycetota bacterium]
MNAFLNPASGPGPIEATSSATASGRKISIDVYRGMVMFLMLAEVLHWSQLNQHKSGFPDWVQTAFDWISYHTSHVEWRGCSLHDMIQPSFSFLVGAALAFSTTRRIETGQSWSSMFLHALFRSCLLVFLGIFLRSLGKPHTNFTFDDTLTQIGLGYWILFLFASLGTRWLFLVTAILLGGYWALFALYPLPSPDFDSTSVGVPANWPEHFTGFEAHWNKNSNPAWAFDTWWMNLFAREKPFLFSAGGYCTLSFIPTLATMVLGLIAGKWMRSEPDLWNRSMFLLTTGLACLSIALILDDFGACPIVKRIWTPSWTLWSGGICFLWLLALHWICDVARFSWWAYPWMVIGANSIVAYVMSWTMEQPTHAALERHFGWLIDRFTNEAFRPMLIGAMTLVFFWLVLHWLYRRRIFVRI